ncbi:MAG: hypothetical protein ACJ766_16460 [Thermoleophilaceae bacterium]
MRVMLVVALAVLVAAPVARAQSDSGCVGDTDASSVPMKPGPRLRFGIGPLVQAGQVGPAPATAKPEQPARTDAALSQLRPARGPFVLRLNRFFWSDGEAGIRRYLELARRFTRRGYLVELQLRYHPTREQEGDIAAWSRFVREVVRKFGVNQEVVAIQIANEVNFRISADSSDGAYKDARQALVSGVIAAKDEVRRLGLAGRVAIGFNWAYRLDPASETSFWNSLRDRGGRAFVAALDWIGLDAYPGTVFPPAEEPGGERDGIVNAMSALRCYARIPGIPASVPMRVEENGWPTQPPARSYAHQAEALRLMVRAVHDFRGTYNVSDYRWFNLRDGDTGSPMLFQHFGLLEDDYDRKPAFAAYRSLVGELSTRTPVASRRPRLRLRLRCRRARVRATVAGADARYALRADFFRGRRKVARDTHPPLSRVVDRGRHRARRRARARVRMGDGKLVRLSKLYRGCRR